MCASLEHVDGDDECLGINALQARSTLADAGHRAGSSFRPNTALMAFGNVADGGCVAQSRNQDVSRRNAHFICVDDTTAGRQKPGKIANIPCSTFVSPPISNQEGVNMLHHRGFHILAATLLLSVGQLSPSAHADTIDQFTVALDYSVTFGTDGTDTIAGTVTFDPDTTMLTTNSDGTCCSGHLHG
jgi:hypothetical protein